MLTDDQCNEFRRLPLSFNDMVRAIYEAGLRLGEARLADAYEKAAVACEAIEQPDYFGFENPYTFQDGITRCAEEIRALKAKP